jgi:two-component system chemotaxis response regulator CheV
MAGVLDSVNQRTQLVGKNRLELLLFRLAGEQMYGLNVFKVREVIRCPKLTLMPRLKAGVKGIAHIRGSAIPVLDLGATIGREAVTEHEMEDSFVIVTEFNQLILGFLVHKVERIINTNWDTIHAPPPGAGKSNYLTAVTELDGQLVEILDVERILAQVAPRTENIDQAVANQIRDIKVANRHVLVVDDSIVARKQLERCLVILGVEVTLKNNGKEAWEYLQQIADSGQQVVDTFFMIISDVEMPEMDGYTLAASIRADERMRGAYIMLHTSLSGMFNKAMVDKVGADDFLSKFQPDELAIRVKNRMDALNAE